MARSTAEVLPEITICSGELMLAGSQTSPCCRFVAEGGDFVEVHAEDCGHRSDADGDGFLHVFSAIANSANGVGEGEGSGADVGGIFAEAVTCDVARFRDAGFEHPKSGDRSGEDRRLCDLGEAELVFGALEAELRELVTECVVGFVESLAGDGIFLE